MDPKLTELFNQLKLVFEHFSEAYEQANAPNSGAETMPPGPPEAPPDVQEELNPERLSDADLNDAILGKKKGVPK
jgi:hypothetical protein